MARYECETHHHIEVSYHDVELFEGRRIRRGNVNHITHESTLCASIFVRERPKVRVEFTQRRRCKVEATLDGAQVEVASTVFDHACLSTCHTETVAIG